MFQELVIGRWFAEVSSRPLEILIGLCIFATAAAGAAMMHVASPSMAILFIVCLFYIHKWPELWRALTRNERVLLLGLGLYAFSGLISYYNVSDEYDFVKYMGRYLRFLLIVPIYLLLSKADLYLFKYLLAGAIVSGPLYLSFALMSYSNKPWLPASGHYHHITFGDGAMLNAVFLLAVLFTWKTRLVIKIILLISILCALYASILSHARGAWLALPFCGVVLFYLLSKYGEMKIKKKVMLPVLFLIVAAIGISPLGSIMKNRVNEAVQDIELFVSGERVDLSIGGRLAMWDIALDVWKEHPFIGTGLADFDQEIELRQSQGIYESIAVHDSAHSIYFQALATTGTIGFVILCFALVFHPFRIFYRTLCEKLTPASLSGVMVVIAYAVFGLTESWMLRSPVIAMFLIYLITLSVTVSGASESANSTSR